MAELSSAVRSGGLSIEGVLSRDFVFASLAYAHLRPAFEMVSVAGVRDGHLLTTRCIALADTGTRSGAAVCQWTRTLRDNTTSSHAANALACCQLEHTSGMIVRTSARCACLE